MRSRITLFSSFRSSAIITPSSLVSVVVIILIVGFYCAPPIETGIGDYGYGVCGFARVYYSWMTFADFPTELGVLGAGEDFIEKSLGMQLHSVELCGLAEG